MHNECLAWSYATAALHVPIDAAEERVGLFARRSNGQQARRFVEDHDRIILVHDVYPSSSQFSGSDSRVKFADDHVVADCEKMIELAHRCTVNGYCATF